MYKNHLQHEWIDPVFVKIDFEGFVLDFEGFVLDFEGIVGDFEGIVGNFERIAVVVSAESAFVAENIFDHFYLRNDKDGCYEI